MSRNLISVTLAWLLVLIPVAHVSNAQQITQAQQTKNISGLEGLPDGNYHLFLQKNEGLSTIQVTFDFVKEKRILRGGFNYAIAGMNVLVLPRTICFGGVLEKNVLTNIWAVELGFGFIRGVLEEFGGIDLSGSNVRRLSATEIDNNIQVCGGINLFYTSLMDMRLEAENSFDQSMAGVKSTLTQTIARIKASSKSDKDSHAASHAKLIQEYLDVEKTRTQYLQQIEKASIELESAVLRKDIPAIEGAKQASYIRNQIKELSRASSSILARSIAETLQKSPRSLADLVESYAKRLYGGRPFSSLNVGERDKVFLEIIRASGRDSSLATTLSKVTGFAGKTLLVATFAVALARVWVSDDKLAALGREGVMLGAGYGGGYTGAFAASFLCGTNPICVVLFVLIGGIIATMGADIGLDVISEWNRQL